MECVRNQSECRGRRIQFFCLLAVLLITLVFFLLEDRASGLSYLLVERWMALPAVALPCAGRGITAGSCMPGSP